MRRVAFILAFLFSPAALAEFSGKVSLTGLYYNEQESGNGSQHLLASPSQLALGDLRVLLSGQRIAQRLDLRFDMRVRATGSFEFEDKFKPDYFVAPMSYTSARGYLGGWEFDLREAYLGVWLKQGGRLGWQLLLGRMLLPEADALKLDGLRLRLRIGEHWEGSAFAGGYPNPYSRSLLTDYAPPCGDGVASGNATLNLGDLQSQNPLDLKFPLPANLKTVQVAPDPCQSSGPQVALAAGLTTRYQYFNRFNIWGTAGIVGAFFGGPGDGGPVKVDPAAPNNVVSNLLPADELRDQPRIYLTWTNHINPAERLDVFSDLVVDLWGSHHTQLTRALLVGNLRLLKQDRLNFRVAYSYMSSLAIDMFLRQLLYNRFPNGTTLAGTSTLGIVENNLTVLRTARHEARLTTDVTLVKRLTLWLEGRLRVRSLLDGDSNPTVYDNPLYTNFERDLGGDATLGLRDTGSVRGLRAQASYTFLQNFRALNHVARIGLGGDMLRERLSLDAEYVLVVTRDGGVGRSGTSHEAGLTLTSNPWGRLFFLLDYRFSALLTDPQQNQAIPMILGNSVLARIEIGF